MRRCARCRHGKRRSPNAPSRLPPRHEPVTLALAIQTHTPPRRIANVPKPPGSDTRRLFVSGSRSADTERHNYVERLVRGGAPSPRLDRVRLINRLTVRGRAAPTPSAETGLTPLGRAVIAPVHEQASEFHPVHHRPASRRFPRLLRTSGAAHAAYR